jgi:hypothetical protein
MRWSVHCGAHSPHSGKDRPMGTPKRAFGRDDKPYEVRQTTKAAQRWAAFALGVIGCFRYMIMGTMGLGTQTK